MTGRIKISDHAAMRWLERGAGLDFDSLKNSMASALDNAFQAAQKLGVSNYLILADGQVFVVRDGTLVTVVPDDGRRLHLLDSIHAPRPERKGA